MGKIKTICKAKELADEENIGEFRKIVGKPKFYCKKCLRVASKKGYLCRGERLCEKAEKKKADT